MKRYSELTFKDLIDSPFGLFVKIFWNGTVIYDDNLYSQIDLPENYVKTRSGNEGIEFVTHHYGEKKVFSIYVHVISFHHTILFIEGEN